MAAFEKKNTDTASVLTNMDKHLEKLELDIVAQRRAIKDQADQAAILAEARRREEEQYQYDLQLRRKAQVDAYAEADKMRDEQHRNREYALKEREDELCTLLGVLYEATITGRKSIQVAFANKLASVEKAAEGRAFGIAKKEFEQAQALKAAEAKTELQLLIQKNQQLEATNKALEAANAKLTEAQNKSLELVTDVAKKGLDSAGAINGRGVSALETAASSFGAGARPGRG